MAEINLGPISINLREIKSISDKIFNYIKLNDNNFSEYFFIVGKSNIDYCVYQSGLRPYIPLIDLLYLEYLKYLLKKEVIKKLLIFPSVDLSFSDQDVEAFKFLEDRIKSIFKETINSIDIIDPFEQKTNVPSVSLLSNEFLKTLQYVSSKDFLKFIRERLGLEIKDYTEFNRYHPEELKLVSIFVHLVRCYIIWNKFLSIGLLKNNEHVNLGFLIWETEVDKLGLFHKLATGNKKITLTAMLGKSCMVNRNKPVPVFREGETINFFEEEPVIVKKLLQKNKTEIKIYENILLTILKENYNFSVAKGVSKKIKDFIKGFSLNNPSLEINSLSKSASRVLYYIVKLKEIYYG